MFVIGNLLQTIAFIVDRVLQLYNLVLIIAVLVSWVRPDPFHPIVQFLRMASEPVFDWIRRRAPFVVVGMLDLSPLVAFLIIYFLRSFVVTTLIDLGLRLR